MVSFQLTAERQQLRDTVGQFAREVHRSRRRSGIPGGMRTTAEVQRMLIAREPGLGQ
jgi:hypothetical protein